nr:hypothetical protein BgiMline_012358 [Biomphalaria glabrata]
MASGLVAVADATRKREIKRRHSSSPPIPSDPFLVLVSIMCDDVIAMETMTGTIPPANPANALSIIDFFHLYMSHSTS